MAQPVIDTRTSLQIVDKGGELDYTPAATNEPTSWAVTNLPAGCSFSTVTGRISGNPTKAGLHQVLLRAINEDGFDEIVLLIPVLETGSTIGQNDITLEVNVDVLTGKVEFLGTGGATWGPPKASLRNDGLKPPVYLVKKGDKFPVAIGFTRNGVLQDLPIDRLLVGSKEFVNEGLLPLTDGTFRTIGTGASKRYVVTLVVGDNVWKGVLSNYEDESGTYVDSHTEIQFSLIQSFGHDAVDQTDDDDFEAPVSANHTFTYEDLPPDNGTYTLALSISTEGGETVELEKKYDLTYSNGTFSAKDQDDPITHRDRYDITYRFSVDITLDTVTVGTDGSLSGTRGMVFRLYGTNGAYVDHLGVASHTSGIWPFLPNNTTYHRGSNVVTWNGSGYTTVWDTNEFWDGDDLEDLAFDFGMLMGLDITAAGWTYTAERISSTVIRFVATRKVRLDSPTPEPYIQKPARAGHFLGPTGTTYAFTDMSVNVVTVPAASPTPTNVLLEYDDAGLIASTRIVSVVPNGLDLKVNLQTIASLESGGGSGSEGGEGIPFTVTGVLTAPAKSHDAYVRTSETFILRAFDDMIVTDNQDLD